MATATSVEDIVNQALAGIGYARAIADIYEGTPAARKALVLYGQARDEVLASRDWQIAAQTLLTNPLKTQTAAYGGNWSPLTQPPVSWKYEWALPSDYIRAMSVLATPSAPGPILDPGPVLWKIINDNQAGGVPAGDRVLVTMIANPILVYMARVTDMTQWDALLIAAVVQNLARKLEVALKEDPKLFQAQTQLEDRAEQQGAMRTA